MPAPSRLKRPFNIAGVAVGAAVSGWYLYANVAPGGRRLPDPVWVRFVNVALIIFVAVYVANLLRRLAERSGGKGKNR